MEKLPKELERICLKAMAKRASERYSSAHDLAEEKAGYNDEMVDALEEIPGTTGYSLGGRGSSNGCPRRS